MLGGGYQIKAITCAGSHALPRFFFSFHCSSYFCFCTFEIVSHLNSSGWPELVQPSWLRILNDGVIVMCAPPPILDCSDYSSSLFKNHPKKPYKKQIVMAHCYSEGLRVYQSQRDGGGGRLLSAPAGGCSWLSQNAENRKVSLLCDWTWDQKRKISRPRLFIR